MNVIEYLQFTTKISLLKIKKKIPENSLNSLTKEELQTLKSLKSESRKNEFIAIRQIRTHLFGRKTIYYNKSGAPYIKKLNTHISIGHTNEYAIIASSEKHPVGVDIEIENRDLKPIQHKFINENEKIIITKEKNKNTPLVIWCIKEALYKLHRSKGINFLNDLNCEKINDGLWKGSIKNEKMYFFHVKNFNNHIICFNIET